MLRHGYKVCYRKPKRPVMGGRTRLVRRHKRGRKGTDMGVGIMMVKATM
jgi:hypothetical protein